MCDHGGELGAFVNLCLSAITSLTRDLKMCAHWMLQEWSTNPTTLGYSRIKTWCFDSVVIVESNNSLTKAQAN
jgi:hypothetical protein